MFPGNDLLVHWMDLEFLVCLEIKKQVIKEEAIITVQTKTQPKIQRGEHQTV